MTAGPNRRLLVAALGFALVLALAFAAFGQALRFPDLTGRVVDAAGMLAPDARQRIEARLAAHEQKTSDQIVVATVPNLQGASIEDYANQAFRHWKLGQARTNNGVLLIVAQTERKVRIEVGYGLEGSLTDALSKVIISAAITPKFKAGDFAGGLEAGVDGIVSILEGDSEWQERYKLRNAPYAPEHDPVLVLAIVLIIFLIIAITIYRSSSRNYGRAHRTRSGRWTDSGSSWGGGWSGGSSSGGWSSGSSSGGFSGGGGSSGGGGASGDW